MPIWEGATAVVFERSSDGNTASVLGAGDEVLAVDGWRVRRLDEVLQWTVRDRPFELLLVRERRLHTLRLEPDVRSPLRRQWRLALDEAAPRPALVRRRAWLGR